MASKNRFEVSVVPVEYGSKSEEIEVKKGEFLEGGELDPEAIARAKEMLEHLSHLYQKEQELEEVVV